jgi:hypothetical protein
MASKWKAGILTATLVVSTMPNVNAEPKHGTPSGTKAHRFSLAWAYLYFWTASTR